jgi:mannitol/fructose-specific phosphotransferase system IIA component (Ntr-type)
VTTGLHLLDYLDTASVAVDLTADDKRSVVEKLVDLVIERGLVADRGHLLDAILRREDIVTTGIGGGIAIPHADLPEIAEPRLMLAVFPDGVDFEALDEEPVFVVFLLLGTPRTPGLHMKILARIARLGKDSELTAGLREAHSAGEALDLLARVEARH